MGEFSRSRCSRNMRKTRGMQTDNRYDLRLFVVAPEKFPLDDGIFLVFSAQAPLLSPLPPASNYRGSTGSRPFFGPSFIGGRV